mmetsp:Transcript_49955/g.100583  ORF Transcript_49955/g.100583 Transcript_49955/m.100583 type:complete len:164 (+) Transcript_49955:119-610(+)|eukprot:CAMPEP_0171840366 /NCGR_PEP_ID=MMETSP0992-20121227/13923_1 /TAXON_ID=483369 /ORGANISM="non described non described, Strain CCMP2098" /LENGTH=163 /DNA_ID=CAMNT_0012457141 /DNA_START=126 /DNA_END=617 /DNA_ORIENTATION=+
MLSLSTISTAFRAASFVAPARRQLSLGVFNRTIPHLHGSDDPNADRITLRWLDKKTNSIVEKTAAVGSTLLEAAHRSDIDLEGACEGSIACSTCHVILEPDIFDVLDGASEDEDDMLDSAFALTETSRLGCQVIVSKVMDNTTIGLPAATRNFYVDGHVPKPH